MQSTCSSCGSIIEEGFAFCGSCGRPVSAEPAGSAPPPPGALEPFDEPLPLDPSTSATELAQIAAMQPEMRAAVAAHPNAYPELLDWLSQQGDPKVDEAIAARPRFMPGDGPVAATEPWSQQSAPPPPPPLPPSVSGAMGQPGPPGGFTQTSSGKKALVPILIISAVVVVAMLIGGVFLFRTVADRLTGGGTSASQDSLYQACADGDMEACTDLYYQSPIGSDAETFGATCGNRAPRGSDCSDLDSSSSVSGSDDTYGDNPELDALWDECEAGNMASCDELYRQSPIGSEYEDFGNYCGGRGREGTWCDE